MIPEADFFVAPIGNDAWAGNARSIWPGARSAFAAPSGVTHCDSRPNSVDPRAGAR